MPKFRPSLLDTLLANSRTPGMPQEVETQSIFPGVRLYSLDRMQEAAYLDMLRRDLSWLLNTISLEQSIDLSGAPEVATSVVNFGVEDFAVRTIASISLAEASSSIAGSIKAFEPRIDPASLSVRGQKGARDSATPSLVFNITCDVGQAENAIRAGFKTNIDIDTGEARLEERR